MGQGLQDHQGQRGDRKVSQRVINSGFFQSGYANFCILKESLKGQCRNILCFWIFIEPIQPHPLCRRLANFEASDIRRAIEVLFFTVHQFVSLAVNQNFTIQLKLQVTSYR